MRLIWIALLASPLSLLIARASAADTEQTEATVPPALSPSRSLFVPGVPTDAELAQRHARIGRIEIQIDEPFENTQQLSAPYRIANGLHIATREPTIAQQLLFRPGDPYSRRTLDEAERLLRAHRYLGEAVIQPIRYNEDNTVDVIVRVHDVWTLSPGLSIGRKGGENSVRLEFEDTNFLGLGKQISFSRASNVDRSSWQAAYTDPNVLGSWWQLSGTYASLSDGGAKAFALSRPFYSLDSRWSLGGSFADTANDVSRYSLGQVVDRFQMQHRGFELGGGISDGLRDGWTQRYLAGLRYDARTFADRDESAAAPIPDDRTYVYPWIGVELLEDAYLKTRNLDQIGRTEDLYLGRSARLELGIASTAFGSTDDALMLGGTLRAGRDLGSEQYLINTLAFDGRLEGTVLRDAMIDLNTRYYRRQSPHRVLFAAVSGSLVSKLDEEEQLLLGGDNGLRGYPLRYQAGTARALLTVEERFYTNWQPLKLFNVGGALFVDAGRTWGRDPYAGSSLGWLKDVGFGLRLGSARSGLGNILRIDLAFPLDGGSDLDRVQLLIESRRSF